MTPYPALQVNKISATSGTIKSYRGSDPSATICFVILSPHYPVRDWGIGIIKQLSTGSRNCGLLFYP